MFGGLRFMVSDFTAFVIAGAVLILFPIMVIAYLQGGFFWHWMRTRASRGKLVLIKVRSPLRDYFKTGHMEEAFLVFKDSNKEEKRPILPTDCVYPCFGIQMVDYDSEKNAFVAHNFDKVSGFDAVKYNHLYIRSLMRPALQDNKTLIIIVLLCLALLGILGVVVITVQTKSLVAAQSGQISAILGKINTTISSAVIS